MSDLTKKIICITGIDGSGKSTIVELLSRKYPNAYVSEIWDLLKQPNSGLPFRSKKDIDSFLCSLTPDSRLLFLMHALKYATDKALKSDSEVLIFNAYFYKYITTELALGANQKLAEDLMESFPDPDIIFLLDLNIETAASRKQKFSRYECGLTEYPNKKSFIKQQQKSAKFWQLFNKKSWNKIDAELSPQTIVNQIIELL